MAFAQCVKGNPHRTRAEFGTPGNMVELGLPVQPFQFDIAIPRAKEIIDLGGDDLGGRPFKRCRLRKRWAIWFQVASFALACGHGIIGHYAIAGHQLPHTTASRCVYEGVFDPQEQEIDCFEQVARPPLRSSHQTLPPVMADLLIEQGRASGRRRRST